MSGGFNSRKLLPYIIAQVLSGIVGAAVLCHIASGKPDLVDGGFASNGFDAHSPGGYSMLSALVTEIVMTFMSLMIILGATHKKAPKGFAGFSIWIRFNINSFNQYSGNKHFG
jgi:aquaporin Z